MSLEDHTDYEGLAEIRQWLQQCKAAVHLLDAHQEAIHDFRIKLNLYKSIEDKHLELKYEGELEREMRKYETLVRFLCALTQRNDPAEGARMVKDIDVLYTNTEALRVSWKQIELLRNIVYLMFSPIIRIF